MMLFKKFTNENVSEKVTVKERLAYGCGDFSSNIMYSAMAAFLLFYYTDVVGVSAAAVGVIMMCSRLFDGVSDLIMGVIIDRTKSLFGKARIWILRLVIPYAIGTVLLFSVPTGWSQTAKLIYIFFSYNLAFTVLFTGINLPYATLTALMTQDQYERSVLSIFRMILATCGTLFIKTCTLPVVKFFGDDARAWTMTFVVLMIVFIVLNMFMFFVCQERVHEESAEGGQNQVSFIKGLEGLFKNKYWLLMVVSLFAMYFMMSCFFGSAVYFTMYNMGNDGYYAMVSNLLSIAQIVTLFITPFLMKKISKRYLFMGGMAVATVGFVLSGLTTSYSLICLSSVIKGIGFGCGGATMFGCLQDAITYGEWYNGYGTAGMGNAASSFCMKVGSGIGTAALGWILAAGGFDAQLKVQSASALSSISIAFAWVPVITCVICVICMAFFNVDKYYAKVVEDLSQGKHRGE